MITVPVSSSVSIALGIDNIRTKSASEVVGEYSNIHRTYTDASAVLSGIVSAICGLFLIVISWALIFNTEKNMKDLIKRHPGLGLLSLSLLMLTRGGHTFAGAREEFPRCS